MTELRTALAPSGAHRRDTSAPRAERAAASPRSPSLARLTWVELRKLTDTRSGYWLLIIIALVAAGMVTVVLFTAPDAEQRFANFFALAQIPVGMLLPILGILLVTSEFSQRTVLTTFALVPQRHRVVVAKLAAGTVAALLAALASAAASAIGTLIAAMTGDGGSWSTNALALAGAALFQVINVLLGIGFGLLFLNTPLAVVLYLLLPTVWSILGEMISRLRKPAEWLDISATSAPLMEPPVSGDLAAGQWARLGVSVAVWVLVPLVVGTVRVIRREVS